MNALRQSTNRLADRAASAAVDSRRRVALASAARWSQRADLDALDRAKRVTFAELDLASARRCEKLGLAAAAGHYLALAWIERLRAHDADRNERIARTHANAIRLRTTEHERDLLVRLEEGRERPWSSIREAAGR